MSQNTLTDHYSVLVICGPTAIGKTAVGMALQDALGGKAQTQLIALMEKITTKMEILIVMISVALQVRFANPLLSQVVNLPLNQVVNLPLSQVVNLPLSQVVNLLLNQVVNP